jgi:ABC-type nitrate/sulfonate/bicarbonate transport system substrate-binding protein
VTLDEIVGGAHLERHLTAAAEVPLAAVPSPRKALRLTWNASAICTVGVPVAQTKGYFDKRNLSVESINFGGSTDPLLEAIATGKADAGSAWRFAGSNPWSRASTYTSPTRSTAAACVC